MFKLLIECDLPGTWQATCVYHGAPEGVDWEALRVEYGPDARFTVRTREVYDLDTYLARFPDPVVARELANALLRAYPGDKPARVLALRSLASLAGIDVGFREIEDIVESLP